MKLNCQGIKDQLTAFADGELDKSQSQAIQAHLDECPACAKEVEAHHALKGNLKKTFSLPEGAVNFNGVWENIEAELDFKPPFWLRIRQMLARPVVWVPSAVATAAVALLIFFITLPKETGAPMVSQVESVTVTSSSEQVWVLQTADSGQPLIWIQTSSETKKEAG
jgi:anti-sigma factor RsiW